MALGEAIGHPLFISVDVQIHYQAKIFLLWTSLLDLQVMKIKIK